MQMQADITADADTLTNADNMVGAIPEANSNVNAIADSISDTDADATADGIAE